MALDTDILTDADDVAHLVSPLALGHYAIDNFRHRTHQKIISDAIVDAFLGRGPRFVAVSIPQQMGKSLVTSVLCPLWVLELHALGILPGGLVGLMSYEDSLAQTWSTKVRRIIEANPENYNCTLRKDSKAASFWETAEGGGILAIGTAGSPQGRPMTLLGMDDITKNFEQAMSPVHQNKIWDNWTSVLYGRLQPWTVVLVTQVRWAPDDFIGRLASEEYEGDPGDWRFIRIPYVCDSPNDALSRDIGEPLIRPQADQTIEQAKQEAAQVEKSVSQYSWHTLWQQNPRDPEGTILPESKWRYWGGDLTTDERVELPRDFDQMLMSWDLTFKDLKSSDWVVGGLWGRVGADYFLLELERGRWGFTETATRIKNAAQRWRYTYPKATTVVIEDKANGPGVIDHLRSSVGGLVEFDPSDYGSKLERAHLIQPFLLGGNMYAPAPSERSWVRSYTKELADFRGTGHERDDQVDMTTQAILHMTKFQYAPVTIASPESLDDLTFSTRFSQNRRAGIL